MDEVSTKNFIALNQFMKRNRKEYEELVERVNGLQATLSTQQSEIASLKQQNAVLHAKILGGGPTS